MSPSVELEIKALIQAKAILSKPPLWTEHCKENAFHTNASKSAKSSLDFVVEAAQYMHKDFAIQEFTKITSPSLCNTKD